MHDTFWTLWRQNSAWTDSAQDTWTIGIFTLVTCIIAADAISRRHPRELYLLTYIFSLVFLLFFALNFAAGWTNRELKDFLGRYAFIYEMLTSTDDEIILVAGVLYLGIGPQVVTYIFTGVFGAASPPILVQQIRVMAVLSLMKFLVGLSAIMLSDTLANAVLGKAISQDDLRLGFFASGFASFLAVLHFRGWTFPSALGFWAIEALIDRSLLGVRWLLRRVLPRHRWRRLAPRLKENPLRGMSKIMADPRLWLEDLEGIEWPGRLHKFFKRRLVASVAPRKTGDPGLISFRVSVDVPLINEVRRLVEPAARQAEVDPSGAASFVIGIAPGDDDKGKSLTLRIGS